MLFASKSQVWVFIFGLASLAVATPAHAIRIARFQIEGQNNLANGQVKGTVEGSCSITLENTSSSAQVVTAVIRVYATVTSGSTSGTCGTGAHSYNGNPHQSFTKVINLAASGTSGVDCGNNTSSTCTLPAPSAASSETMTFPMLCELNTVIQTVRCEGEIRVDDASGAAPGHIVASGTLTTFTESVGGVSLGTDIFGRNTTGGSSKTNAATPTFTPIVIGEGRPF